MVTLQEVLIEHGILAHPSPANPEQRLVLPYLHVIITTEDGDYIHKPMRRDVGYTAAWAGRKTATLFAQGKKGECWIKTESGRWVHHFYFK